MNLEQQLNGVKQQLEDEKIKRDNLLKSNSDNSGVVNLTIESLLEMKGLDNRINKLNSEIISLINKVNEEKRNKSGYQVFGLTKDNDMESRFIPVELKEKYDIEFDVTNSINLPSVENIDSFLMKEK